MRISRRNLLLAAFIFILAAVVSCFSWFFPRVKNPDYVTWIWDLPSVLRKYPDTVIPFLQQHRVKTVYLYADVPLQEKETFDLYRTFIRQAHDAKVEVHALAGERDWPLPDKFPNLGQFLDKVKAYNTAAAAAERFTGIHLDVEPYLLPEWQTNRPQLIRGWTDMMVSFSAYVRSHSLKSGVDLPFWLNTIQSPDRKPMDEWMMDHADSVTIMAYRNRAEGPNGILDLVKPAMGAAARKKSIVYVGVDLSPEQEKGVSFFDENIYLFHQEMKRIQMHFSRSRSYGGVAVHELENWMLKEKQLR